MTFGRVPARLDAHVQRGYPFRAAIVMRDGSDFPASVEMRFDSGAVWAATITGDSASWDVPAEEVDATARGERFELVLDTDVVWATGRAVEDTAGGFGGQASILAVPQAEGGQVITSPAIKGEVGPAPVLAGGDVTTLDPGQPAQASLVPLSPSEYRLDLALPRGADGGTDESVSEQITTGTLTQAALAAAPPVAAKVTKGDLGRLVTDHGATGDGAANDTTAFTSAIAAVQATGGGVVRVPAGTYSTNAFDVPAGVELRSDEGAVLTMRASSPRFIRAYSGARIRNLTIDSAGLASSYGVEVVSNHTAVTIENVTIKNAIRGVEMRPGTSDITVKNVVFEGCANPVRVNNNVTRPTIADCTFTDWTDRGIYVLGNASGSAQHLRIERNYFDPHTGTSNTPARQPIAFQGVAAMPFRYVYVNYNTVIGRGTAYNDTTTPGSADLISLHQVLDGEVIGNIATLGGDVGITVSQTCDRVVVNNNIATLNNSSGICIGSSTSGYTRNVTLDGNISMNNGQNRLGMGSVEGSSGIRFVKADRCIVSGNILGDDQDVPTQKNGIAFLTSSDITIAPNQYIGAIEARFNVTQGPNLRITFDDDRTVTKAATTTRNNHASGREADPHLSLAVEAGGIYRVEGYIIYNSSSTADLGCGWVVPAGASLQWTGGGAATNAVTSGGSLNLRSLSAAQGVVVGGDGSDAVARPLGTLTVGTTAGALTFAWTQSTPEATDTRVLAGSWLRVVRIG